MSARPAVIFAALATIVLAGCPAVLQPAGCSYSVNLLRKDANSCAADPKAMPGCIVGVWLLRSCPI
jgi:hypothetical protein